MFDRHYQQQARADIIAAMHDVVHTRGWFDIHSVTHCMLCAYYQRSEDKHPEVERFTSEYVSQLFSLPDAVVSDVFALNGPGSYTAGIGMQYNPQANLARLVAAFEEHPL